MVQKTKTKPAPQEQETTTPKPKNEEATAEESSSDLDDLIDAIDDVLEKNAEEFISNFIQRGGE